MSIENPFCIDERGDEADPAEHEAYDGQQSTAGGFEEETRRRVGNDRHQNPVPYKKQTVICSLRFLTEHAKGVCMGGRYLRRLYRNASAELPGYSAPRVSDSFLPSTYGLTLQWSLVILHEVEKLCNTFKASTLDHCVHGP